MALLVTFTKHLKNFFQNIGEEETLINWFYEACITLMQKSEIHVTKKTYIPISLMNIDAKFSTNTSQLNEAYKKNYKP